VRGDEMYVWVLGHPERNTGPGPRTDVCAIVDGQQVLVVLQGRLAAAAATDLDPLCSWLGSEHCTDVLVDADDVIEIDDAATGALARMAQQVRIGGGGVAVVASSPAFRHRLTSTCDVSVAPHPFGTDWRPDEWPGHTP
jgi:anti-anti-sigma regulatory factor